jgi:hypothetical protein
MTDPALQHSVLLAVERMTSITAQRPMTDHALQHSVLLAVERTTSIAVQRPMTQPAHHYSIPGLKLSKVKKHMNTTSLVVVCIFYVSFYPSKRKTKLRSSNT